jgi:hypothetical protein
MRALAFDAAETVNSSKLGSKEDSKVGSKVYMLLYACTRF